MRVTTTVATDGKTLAACGLATTQWGLILSLKQKKIIRTASGRIYGIAGAYAAFEDLVNWYDLHAEMSAPLVPDRLPPTPDTDPWTMLVREKDGRWLMLSRPSPYPIEVPLPWAIGSGADMAIGAMEAGADPRKAVEIVSRRTTVSGGEIDVMEIDAAEQMKPKD